MSRVPFPSPLAPTHPPPHTVRIASSLTSTSRPRARRVVPARPDTTTARRPRIVVDSRIRIRIAVVVVDAVIAIEEHATRLETKRNETNARTNASTRIARASDTHARTHACIIRIHPRGTTLTDHDSPPRDSIAIGGAADFARAIVISGRGCRFDESRPVVESPTPDARDRSSRRSRGCARARMVSMSPVMTRGTMCKQ